MQGQQLSRRDAIVRALALVGASTSLMTLAACERSLLPDATRGRFFDADEMAIISDVCDLMIPSTETPGAVAADVPAFIDTMMLSWAGTAAKAGFRRAVAAFDGAAEERFASRYAALATDDRARLVEAVDRDSYARPERQEARDYRALKQLVLLGYQTSQAANPHYVAVPGRYAGDLSKQQYDALVAERS